jgi:P-type Mg2+ transporter
VVTVGAVLPFTPLGHVLGFRPLPGPFFVFLVVAIVSYLALIEVGKSWFYRSYRAPATTAPRHRRRGYRVRRRAARFTTRTLRPARRPVEGNAPNASAV